MKANMGAIIQMCKTKVSSKSKHKVCSKKRRKRNSMIEASLTQIWKDHQ